jgi:hypothetical protein
MSIDRELERDIDWRFEELAALRLFVGSTADNSTAQRAGLRALWAMLYAHYEGFAKFALDLYLDYLERENVVRSQLRDSLASFSAEAMFRALRGDTSSKTIWAFVTNTFPAALEQIARFETKPDTKSNLWPALLKEHCDTMSLLVPSVETETVKLRTLVARRNEIAHGKPNVIKSLAEYSKYEDAVSAVIYELAIAVSEAVRQKEYLSSAITASSASSSAPSSAQVSP